MTDNTINNDLTMGGATGTLLAGRLFETETGYASRQKCDIIFFRE